MHWLTIIPLPWRTDGAPAEQRGDRRGRGTARSPSPATAAARSEPGEPGDSGGSPPPPLISVERSDAGAGSAGEGIARAARADSLPPLTSDEQRESDDDEEEEEEV